MTWFGIDTAVYSCRGRAMGCGACSTSWAGQMPPSKGNGRRHHMLSGQPCLM